MQFRSVFIATDKKQAEGENETSIEAVQAVQRKIEEEMKQRKEKLEAWRAQRTKEEGRGLDGVRCIVW